MDFSDDYWVYTQIWGKYHDNHKTIIIGNVWLTIILNGYSFPHPKNRGIVIAIFCFNLDIQFLHQELDVSYYVHCDRVYHYADNNS